MLLQGQLLLLLLKDLLGLLAEGIADVEHGLEPGVRREGDIVSFLRRLQVLEPSGILLAISLPFTTYGFRPLTPS